MVVVASLEMEEEEEGRSHPCCPDVLAESLGRRHREGSQGRGMLDGHISPA
jgi:hypothetical protein